MLSKLDFGSCYVYSVRGTSPESQASRVLRDQLKKGDRQFIGLCADRVAQFFQQGHYGDLFGLDVTLVPVPGSAPLLPGALWVPLRICEELRARGLGGEVVPAVTRATAVRKSAFTAGPDRPSLKEHYDSMTSDWITTPPAERVVLVDDVITSGCTMLAAASRAAEAFGRVPFRGFALARAMSTEEVQGTRAPCLGLVRASMKNGKAYRRP